MDETIIRAMSKKISRHFAEDAGCAVTGMDCYGRRRAMYGKARDEKQ